MSYETFPLKIEKDPQQLIEEVYYEGGLGAQIEAIINKTEEVAQKSLESNTEISPLSAKQLSAAREASSIIEGVVNPDPRIEGLVSDNIMISYSRRPRMLQLAESIQQGLQKTGMHVWRDIQATNVNAIDPQHSGSFVERLEGGHQRKHTSNNVDTQKLRHLFQERDRGIAGGQDWKLAIDRGISVDGYGLCLISKEALDKFGVISVEIQTIIERGTPVFAFVGETEDEIKETKDRFQGVIEAIPNFKLKGDEPSLDILFNEKTTPEYLGNLILTKLSGIEKEDSEKKSIEDIKSNNKESLFDNLKNSMSALNSKLDTIIKTEVSRSHYHKTPAIEKVPKIIKLLHTLQAYTESAIILLALENPKQLVKNNLLSQRTFYFPQEDGEDSMILKSAIKSDYYPEGIHSSGKPLDNKVSPVIILNPEMFAEENARNKTKDMLKKVFLDIRKYSNSLFIWKGSVGQALAEMEKELELEFADDLKENPGISLANQQALIINKDDMENNIAGLIGNIFTTIAMKRQAEELHYVSFDNRSHAWLEATRNPNEDLPSFLRGRGRSRSLGF